ncbi:hypothetical protein JB92DRAFT_2833335 [Gautieria morchelliformis]|nr:hypothetical protein JB92DRAFT_2833335 [Gautieria morchelliformis]
MTLRLLWISITFRQRRLNPGQERSAAHDAPAALDLHYFLTTAPPRRLNPGHKRGEGPPPLDMYLPATVTQSESMSSSSHYLARSLSRWEVASGISLVFPTYRR